MKRTFLIIAAMCFLGGCAATEEAYFVDREFGEAQMKSWDKMIANPDSQNADRQPEGMEGIHAESAMKVYHESFSKKPTETNIIQFGITGE